MKNQKRKIFRQECTDGEKQSGETGNTERCRNNHSTMASHGRYREIYLKIVRQN